MENISILSLPKELLGLVIDSLDGPARASFGRTCRSLKVLTTPYLYKRAEIKQDKGTEFARTVIRNHASLVQHVSMVSKTLRSPCRVAPGLHKLKNLQSLELVGPYWMWDSDEKKGKDTENWAALEKIFWDYLEKASLKHAVGPRVSQKLRSLTLDRSELSGSAALLQGPQIFLIPQLVDLKLRGFSFSELDAEIDYQFERKTDLQSLRFENTFVSFEALRSVLRAPRALRCLSIEHREAYSDSEPNNATIPEFLDALLLHRESLEEIRVGIDAGNGVSALTVNDAYFQPYADQFPKMKRWEGCDQDNLNEFLRPELAPIYMKSDKSSDCSI